MASSKIIVIGQTDVAIENQQEVIGSNIVEGVDTGIVTGFIESYGEIIGTVTESSGGSGGTPSIIFVPTAEDLPFPGNPRYLYVSLSDDPYLS